MVGELLLPRDDGVLSMLRDHAGHGGLLSMTKVLTRLCSGRYFELLPAVENFPSSVLFGFSLRFFI